MAADASSIRALSPRHPAAPDILELPSSPIPSHPAMASWLVTGANRGIGLALCRDRGFAQKRFAAIGNVLATRRPASPSLRGGLWVLGTGASPA